MRVLELTTKEGQSYLYDMETGWEIYDKGDQPAHWVNHRESRNLNASETYAEVRSQLFGAIQELRKLVAEKDTKIRLLHEEAVELWDTIEKQRVKLVLQQEAALLKRDEVRKLKDELKALKANTAEADQIVAEVFDEGSFRVDRLDVVIDFTDEARCDSFMLGAPTMTGPDGNVLVALSDPKAAGNIYRTIILKATK